MNQSVPVAVIAIAWMTFMTIVVMFPTTPSPTADTMNYTVVVLGGVLILALAYFYCPVYGGVYWFQGPIKNVSTVVQKKVEVEGSGPLEKDLICDTGGDRKESTAKTTSIIVEC